MNIIGTKKIFIGLLLFSVVGFTSLKIFAENITPPSKINIERLFEFLILFFLFSVVFYDEFKTHKMNNRGSRLGYSFIAVQSILFGRGLMSVMNAQREHQTFDPFLIIAITIIIYLMATILPLLFKRSKNL